MGRCQKCGSTDVWEDNFWSGCNKCDWAASCEHNIVVVPCNNSNSNSSNDDDDDDYTVDDDDY